MEKSIWVVETVEAIRRVLERIDRIKEACPKDYRSRARYRKDAENLEALCRKLTRVAPGKSYEWYRIECSTMGEEDWHSLGGYTYETLDSARAWAETGKTPGFDYRLVRVTQTEEPVEEGL